MWFAPGSVELEAFKELDQASDRSAAIVGGSIVESVITEAVKCEYKSDESALTKQVRGFMFNPDGPLGSFGAMIGMAYLQGFLTPEAVKDLRNLKQIRNLFAHNTEHRAFSSEKVTARCKNFVLIDSHVFGPSFFVTDPETGIRKVAGDSIGLGRNKVHLSLVSKDEALTTARGRYMATVLLFSAAFYYYEKRLKTPDEEPRLVKPIL